MLNRCFFNILFVALFTAISCNKSERDCYIIKSNADVSDYIEKEGEKNIYEKKIKEINFRLRYVSNEQMALQQIIDVSKIKQEQFDSIVKNYDSLLFFNLEIVIDDFSQELINYKLGENQDESFNQRVDYYSFQMQKDVNIVISETDTIPCIFYHFERNYGVSPKNKFMLGFKLSNFKNGVLVYNNPFLNTGTIKFALKAQEILHPTHIKID